MAVCIRCTVDPLLQERVVLVLLSSPERRVEVHYLLDSFARAFASISILAIDQLLKYRGVMTVKFSINIWSFQCPSVQGGFRRKKLHVHISQVRQEMASFISADL